MQYVLPVIFLLLLGMFTFSIMRMTWDALLDAFREAWPIQSRVTRMLTGVLGIALIGGFVAVGYAILDFMRHL